MQRQQYHTVEHGLRIGHRKQKLLNLLKNHPKGWQGRDWSFVRNELFVQKQAGQPGFNNAVCVKTNEKTVTFRCYHKGFESELDAWYWQVNRKTGVFTLLDNQIQGH